MSRELSDLHALSQRDLSRLTIPGDIAKAAGWPVESKEIECYAFFRSEGELLCSPVGAKTAQGLHPFHRQLLALPKSDNSEIFALEDLPEAPQLAMPYRFRCFSASWVSGTSQINLKLGAAYLSQLGWIDDERPPIYPVALQQIICLYSYRKLQEIHRLALSELN